MEPADWFTISRNVLGASKFYLQSPFRFSYFRAVSLIFFVDIVVCALILLKFWRRFGFLSFGWLGCGMFLLVALWFLALRTHERLNLLLTTGFRSKNWKSVRRWTSLSVLRLQSPMLGSFLPAGPSPGV